MRRSEDSVREKAERRRRKQPRHSYFKSLSSEDQIDGSQPTLHTGTVVAVAHEQHYSNG